MPGGLHPRRIRLRPGLILDEEDVEWRFVRAAGPGGQNVNKVATAAQLRYDARAHLPPEVFARLRRIAGSRLSDKGVLMLTARSQRTQAGNRRESFARLEEILRRAVIPPRTRSATQPTEASRVRRLDAKRKHGRAKARRRQVAEIDD